VEKAHTLAVELVGRHIRKRVVTGNGQFASVRHQNNIILITFNLLLRLFIRRDAGMFLDNKI
jgi:hypothetical protein